MTRFLLIWSKINERWYFGMHMADALVAPAVATTMYLCSAAAGGYSVRQVRALNEPKKVPVMGVMMRLQVFVFMYLVFNVHVLPP